jgi:DNA-directed RNA polymerase specialized sigma24 family protein
MASMLLDDIDAASDIVAATFAAACRPTQYPQASSKDTRIGLARSVYWRCIGRLAAIERFGTATPQSPPDPGRSASGTAEPDLKVLSSVQRAVLALTVFGGHDLRQLANTLQIPKPTVTRQIRELMSVFDRGNGTDALAPRRRILTLVPPAI